MANLNNQIEIAKLERLIKIQTTIFKASEKVERLTKWIANAETSRGCTEYLFYDRNAEKHKLKIAEMAYSRLLAYYSKQTFEVYTKASRWHTNYYFKNAEKTAESFFEMIDSITSDYKVTVIEQPKSEIVSLSQFIPQTTK